MTARLKRVTIRESLEFLAGSRILASEDGNDVLPVLAALAPTGTIYCVDSANGVDTNPGTSWGAPLLTIAAAVALAAAGDTILLKGSFNEAVTCSLAGVRFIGVGTGPKQAIWTAPTVAASFCLSPAANYIYVENIYFKPVIYTTSGVPSAIRLSGSNWLTIKGCRFQGQTNSYTAIYSPVCDSDNVHILDCGFYYLNTATNGCAILGVEAGGLSYSGWVVKDCIFHSCLKCIDVNMRAGTITGCTFNEYGINPAGAITQLMSLGIDLSGTSSGCNAVWGNSLGGTYNATLYKVGASGDQWAGNFNVITGGLTAANPA
jgi:hypothetical protein